MEEATESNTKPERKGEGAASAALPQRLKWGHRTAFERQENLLLATVLQEDTVLFG